MIAWRQASDCKMLSFSQAWKLMWVSFYWWIQAPASSLISSFLLCRAADCRSHKQQINFTMLVWINSRFLALARVFYKATEAARINKLLRSPCTVCVFMDLYRQALKKSCAIADVILQFSYTNSVHLENLICCDCAFSGNQNLPFYTLDFSFFTGSYHCYRNLI